MAEVVPLLKDGDHEIADNNRPVWDAFGETQSKRILLCEVWNAFGETQSKRFQKLQNRAFRIILNMSNDVNHAIACSV